MGNRDDWKKLLDAALAIIGRYLDLLSCKDYKAYQDLLDAIDENDV